MNVLRAFEKYTEEVITYLGRARKTEINYRDSVRSFIAVHGNIHIEDITQQHFVVWRREMTIRGLRASTMSSRIIRIRNLLQHFYDLDYPVLNPKTIRLPAVRRDLPKYLEVEEVRRLIDGAEDIRAKALIALLYSTACRLSELRYINIEDIQEDEVIVRGKGNKHRTVFIDHYARSLLYQYLNSRADNLPYLFTGLQPTRLSGSRIDQIIKESAANAGLDKIVSPHVLRHSKATDLAKQGMPLAEIKEILGHENLQTTMMYVHYSKHHLKASYYHYQSRLDK